MVILAVLSVAAYLLFLKYYPIKEKMVAIGGNASVSLVEHGFLAVLTEGVEVMLAEDAPPTSFFMVEFNQVNKLSVTLPKKPAIVLEEDEFDTPVLLNYFDTDLPVYSAGPLQILYTVTANSSAQDSSADSCPLQIFLFNDNSTFQQSLVDSKISGYIEKSPCLLNASQGSYYVNQMSRTNFTVEQDKPRFYFVLAYIKKGVHMIAEIEVELTVYNTDGLSPIPCMGDTFPGKCIFDVSNRTIDLSSRKMCLFAKSVDAVAPPYFTVIISSTVNVPNSILIWILLIVLVVLIILILGVCASVTIYYFKRKRRTPTT